MGADQDGGVAAVRSSVEEGAGALIYFAPPHMPFSSAKKSASAVTEAEEGRSSCNRHASTCLGSRLDAAPP